MFSMLCLRSRTRGRIINETGQLTARHWIGGEWVNSKDRLDSITRRPPRRLARMPDAERPRPHTR